MARFLAKDFQSVFRGLRQVAQNGFDHQLSDGTLRWQTSSLRPIAGNCVRNFSLKQSPSFNLSDIPSQIGAVVTGVQEQLKVMMGISRPALVTPEGFVFYTDKFEKSTQKQYPTVAEEVHSAKQGIKPQDGEACEAAKRAKEFMNPPMSPMDPEDKNEVVRTPEMTGTSPAAEINAEESGKAAQRLGKFMNEEVAEKDDKSFRKDSSKTKLSFTDGSSETFRLQDIKKVNNIPPGMPVALDA